MVGFYAGSFDPFTNGHLELVKKAVNFFDKVIIGIGDNLEKKSRFDKQKMRNAIEETLLKEGINNVEVIIYNTLTTNEAKKYGANILIRGLRNGTDYQYEENIAQLNEVNSGFDTCYFRAGKYGFLSSSIVMDLYVHREDVSKYVPEAVYKVMVEG